MYAYGLPLTAPTSDLVIAITGRLKVGPEYSGAIGSVVVGLFLGGWQNLQRIVEGKPLKKSRRN